MSKRRRVGDVFTVGVEDSEAKAIYRAGALPDRIRKAAELGVIDAKVYRDIARVLDDPVVKRQVRVFSAVAVSLWVSFWVGYACPI